MFAPTKTWRRWHQKVNKNQRRYAIASALAASALPALVMARGHRIEQIPEVPLVVADKTIVDIEKTSGAVALLKNLNAYADVEKSKESRQLRRGKGKMRNRRHTQRRGPLIIYDQKAPLVRAFRNLPGVELVCVDRLNLLHLAPGGHLGRFVIWTKSAFEKLDTVFGTYRKASAVKKDYKLPRSLLTNPDISRVINSDEIQSKLRPAEKQRRTFIRKKNPLRNKGFLHKLNPFAFAQKARQAKFEKLRSQKRAAVVEAKRKGSNTAEQKAANKAKEANRKAHRAFVKKILA